MEYIEWNDERMLRTIAAIREELDAGDGLLYRYRRDDGLAGREGAFLCCSFWLAEASRRPATEEARHVFDRGRRMRQRRRAVLRGGRSKAGEPLGNFPQGLTHLAHIDAAVALADRPECRR